MNLRTKISIPRSIFGKHFGKFTFGSIGWKIDDAIEVESSNLCRFRPLYHIRRTTTMRKALGLTPFRNIELVNSTVSLGKNVVQRQSNYHRAMKTLSSTGNADILAPRRILDASSANLRSNIDIAEHATCSKQESSNYGLYSKFSTLKFSAG